VSRPLLRNHLARKLFLARHGLLAPPRTQPLAALLDGLGFVQVDSVLTLARAHDLILWSRSPGYRPPDLQAHLRRRAAFEHWTHDASVLPMAAWPHWRHRFARDRARMDARWEAWHGGDFLAEIERTLRHVAENGGTRSADLLGEGPRKEPGWWNWHPSKVALEYLWRSGELSVSHRESFQKVYDLTERVIPDAVRAQAPPLQETVAWAASAALDRLGFTTPGEIAAFFALLTPAEAQSWAREALRRGEVEEIEVEGADGRLAAASPAPAPWTRPRACPTRATACRLPVALRPRPPRPARGRSACGASATGSRSSCPPRDGSSATTSSPSSRAPARRPRRGRAEGRRGGARRPSGPSPGCRWGQGRTRRFEPSSTA
jgi:uncharacterized protein YcaQ